MPPHPHDYPTRHRGHPVGDPPDGWPERDLLYERFAAGTAGEWAGPCWTDTPEEITRRRAQLLEAVREVGGGG
jgi:hypothetical protein